MSKTGIVVEEGGRVWLLEFGPPDLVVKGGQFVAVVGPLGAAARESVHG